MGLQQFCQTLRRISLHRGGSRFRAVARHFMWQFQRHWGSYPYDIALTPKSRLIVRDRVGANGCAALSWSLGRYDYDNMAFLQDVLERVEAVKTFFDIGANIGVYSLLASENERVRVIAFEPHPVTAALLAANLETNNRSNVEVVRGGLSRIAGSVAFTNEPGSPMNKLVDSNSSQVESLIQVPVERREEFCKKRGIVPDIIKVDVEGHEVEVLEGFGPLLRDVKMLIVEENLPKNFLWSWLPSERFTSCYIDFNKREFGGKSSAWKQDIIYLNNEFIPALSQCGYLLKL